MLCPKVSGYSLFQTRQRPVRQRCASTGSYRPKRESGNCNSRHAVRFSFFLLSLSLSNFSHPRKRSKRFAAFAMRPLETVLEPPFASRIDGCRIHFAFAHFLLFRPGGFRFSGWLPRDAHSAFGRLQAQRGQSTVAQLDRRLFKGSPLLRAARRIERCYEYVQPTGTEQLEMRVRELLSRPWM
ncbi:hypothetical protein V8C34DRAFT_316275 [Trichoderma compactum]